MSNKFVTLKNLGAYTEELQTNILPYQEIIQSRWSANAKYFLDVAKHTLDDRDRISSLDYYESVSYKIMPMKVEDFIELIKNSVKDVVDFHSYLGNGYTLNFIGYAYINTRPQVEEVGEIAGEAESAPEYSKSYSMDGDPVKVVWSVEQNNGYVSNNVDVYANDWTTISGSVLITGDIILSRYFINTVPPR